MTWGFDVGEGGVEIWEVTGEGLLSVIRGDRRPCAALASMAWFELNA